nr:hypothetical protein [uncultured Cohaesibacter sp.]
MFVFTGHLAQSFNQGDKGYLGWHAFHIGPGFIKHGGDDIRTGINGTPRSIKNAEMVI